MTDLIFIGLITGIFMLAIVYLNICERLRNGGSHE